MRYFKLLTIALLLLLCDPGFALNNHTFEQSKKANSVKQVADQPETIIHNKGISQKHHPVASTTKHSDVIMTQDSHYKVLLNQYASVLLAFLNQNKGGIVQNDPKSAHYWLNRHLVLSALTTGDAGLSNRHPSQELDSLGRYNPSGVASASLTNVILYADALIVHGVTIHLAGIYNNNHGIFQRYDQDNGLTSLVNTDGSLHSPSFERPDFQLDEAYFRIQDFERSPFFIEGGRFYQPFGNYELHPLIQSLPQQLSQTQGNSIELGVASPISQRLGNIEWLAYLFNDAYPPASSRYQHQSDFGTQLAYSRETDAYGYKMDVGYLNNMNLVDFIATTTASPLSEDKKRVGAIAFDWFGHAGPFDTHLNFVSALQTFSPLDATFNDHGAIPKAIDIGTGYRFDLFKHDSHFGLSYQHSWQAASIGLGSIIAGAGLPKHRVQADYTFNVLKNLNLQFLVHYDKDYRVEEGGTDKSSVTGLVRIALGLA